MLEKKTRLLITRQTVYFNNCCRRKAVSFTYSGCVFLALFIQHAMRMRRVILSSMPCPDLQCFPTLSHKRTIFGENVIEHKVFALILSTTFLKHFSFKEYFREVLANTRRHSGQVTVVLLGFNET